MYDRIVGILTRLATDPWRYLKSNILQLFPFVILAVLILAYVAGFYILDARGWTYDLRMYTGLKTTRGFSDGGQLIGVINKHSTDDRSVWRTNSQSPYVLGRFQIENRSSPGSVQNARQLHDGDAQLAILQDGMIGNDELAQGSKDDDSHIDREIRSLYHLGQSFLYVVIRKRDDRQYKTIADFTEQTRVYLGQPGSAAHLVAERVLQFYRSPCVRMPRGAEAPSPCEVVASMGGAFTLPAEQEVDVAFILGNPHVNLALKETEPLKQCSEDIIRYIADRPDRFEILPVDRADALAWTFQFLDPVRLEKGCFPSREVFPKSPIQTVATNSILACRADLPEAQAYQIVRTLNAHQNKLAHLYGDPTPISKDDPQHAFKYRLHKGARSYYGQATDDDLITIQFMLGLVGVCFTAAIYFNNTSIKRRVDLLARDIEGAFAEHGIPVPGEAETPGDLPDAHESKSKVGRVLERLQGIKRQALEDYRGGIIDTPGYQRIKECVDLAVADLKPLDKPGR